MNLLSLYRWIPFFRPITSLALYSYHYGSRLFYKIQEVAQKEWSDKDILENFALLSEYKATPLARRVCSKRIYGTVPYVHQGILGTDTEQEANAMIQTALDVASAAVGVGISLVSIGRFFNECLANDRLLSCSYIGSADLFSSSGISLLTGSYLASWAAKNFLIIPIAQVFVSDSFHRYRFVQIAAEYGKIAAAITELVKKPSDDEQVQKTAQIARKFLHIVPRIERDLHTFLAIDKKEATACLTYLKAACHQLLIHASLKGSTKV